MAKKYDFSNLSVLVVDDNNHMISIVKTLLRAFGANKIRDVHDAISAFEEMKSRQIDLVITDCAMPTFDGIEFTQMVRTAPDSPNPYVPIIMLTAYTERQRIEEARDAGVTEILRKPISAFDLYLRILEVIERPRVFVKTKRFFGPDRRRHPGSQYSGPDRRAPDLFDSIEVDNDGEAAA